MLFAALVVAAAANFALLRWGRLTLSILTVLLGLAVWLVFRQYPLLAAGWLEGHPYLFYRPNFIAYSFFGIGFSSLALSSGRVGQGIRVIMSVIVGFAVAWCGALVS